MKQKKVMTFNQAKKKLSKIANGRYYQIGYKITVSSFDEVEDEPECSLYIDGYAYFISPNWEGAFLKLKESMFPKLKEAPNMKQAPQ